MKSWITAYSEELQPQAGSNSMVSRAVMPMPQTPQHYSGDLHRFEHSTGGPGVAKHETRKGLRILNADWRTFGQNYAHSCGSLPTIAIS